MAIRLGEAKRYGLPFSFILFDLDHFKSVNDTNGHQFGDLVLREAAQLVRGQIRKEDVLTRYGGEEFGIISPHTDKIGATILAEVLGGASTADAHHITQPAPEGEGGARAMKIALEDAGIKPHDIDYINAHGTSTILNDKNETMAMKTVFGDHARAVTISSTKSMTGHLLGASGSLEAAVSSMVIQRGAVPPTMNLDVPDPDCDLDYTANAAKNLTVEIAMTNSFGFGGHNSSLVFSKPQNGVV